MAVLWAPSVWPSLSSTLQIVKVIAVVVLAMGEVAFYPLSIDMWGEPNCTKTNIAALYVGMNISHVSTIAPIAVIQWQILPIPILRYPVFCKMSLECVKRVILWDAVLANKIQCVQKRKLFTPSHQILRALHNLMKGLPLRRKKMVVVLVVVTALMSVPRIVLKKSSSWCF
jgi:hypothetical protein